MINPFIFNLCSPGRGTKAAVRSQLGQLPRVGAVGQRRAPLRPRRLRHRQVRRPGPHLPDQDRRRAKRYISYFSAKR